VKGGIGTAGRVVVVCTKEVSSSLELKGEGEHSLFR
jgi:hypothetical protein